MTREELREEIAALTTTECLCGIMGGDYTADVMALLDRYEREQCLVAAAIAHRVCIANEHDPMNGKLHGCCVVCGAPWPCESAARFLPPGEELNP